MEKDSLFSCIKELIELISSHKAGMITEKTLYQGTENCLRGAIEEGLQNQLNQLEIPTNRPIHALTDAVLVRTRAETNIDGLAEVLEQIHSHETIHYSYGSRRTTTETSRLSGEQASRKQTPLRLIPMLIAEIRFYMEFER
uniref:hypothetical protein n=1 Tax=Jatropha curcas TaxID=180498 RepID=UPI0027A63FF1|nr:hypothetical protein QLP06_mgp060 [Jatropha curcas]WFG81179.1 hypothetical protein [Jatropha curcas]